MVTNGKRAWAIALGVAVVLTLGLAARPALASSLGDHRLRWLRMEFSHGCVTQCM